MATIDDKRRTLESVKPFKLVKYVAVSSLMVIMSALC